MADNVRISQQSTALTLRAPSRPGAGGAQMAQTAPSQPMGNDEFQRAVTKLNNTLESGQELRTNVPRGFYLNIRV